MRLKQVGSVGRFKKRQGWEKWCSSEYAGIEKYVV
jgi:hypothetical protein